MRTSLTSTAAGLTVAFLGLLSLLWLMGPAPADLPSAEPGVESETVSVTAVATTEPERVVITVETAVPDLAGVGSAATSVLYARGYAEHVTSDDLPATLPPAVFALLVEHGATLTVAVDGAGDVAGDAP